MISGHNHIIRAARLVLTTVSADDFERLDAGSSKCGFYRHRHDADVGCDSGSGRVELETSNQAHLFGDVIVRKSQESMIVELRIELEVKT